MLADGLSGRRPGGFPLGHDRGIGHEARRDGQLESAEALVEAERLRGLHEFVCPELDAELGEGGVGRHLGRALEGNRAVFGPVVVGDLRVADIDRRRRVDLGLGSCDIVFEQSRERHDLKGRTRGVQRARRTVDQRAGIVVGARVQKVFDVVGVVVRRRGHGQDRAGLRIHDHDGALVAGELLFGSFLDIGIQRERDVVARRLDARGAFDHVLPGREVRLALERVVHGRFDAREAVALRIVADHMARERAFGVDALVRAVALRLAFGKDHPVVSRDGSAFGGCFLIEGVVVARVALVVVRLHDHDVGEVGHEHGEEHGEGDHRSGQAFSERNASEHAGFRGGVAADGRHARRAVGYFGRKAGALVARAQQQADGDEAGEQGRSALADEGQRDAGQGDEARDAADDDEGLQHDDDRGAYGHEGADVALGARSGCKSPDGKRKIQQQHAGAAQKPRLFGDGGEDEV